MRKFMQWAGIVTAVVLGVLTAAVGPAQATVPQGYYNEIIARHSDKCLDVANAGLDDGQQVNQWSCRGGLNQDWYFENRGNGWYGIRARHSWKCLDVAGGSLDQGAMIVQATCHFRGNQLWRFDDQVAPFFRLIAQHSGKCLDVSGADRGDGAAIVQSYCHDGTNQQFRLFRTV